MRTTTEPTHGYRWGDLLDMVLSHRRALFTANLVAIGAAVISVPIPLLMPILVDEVLLDQPGTVVGLIDAAFPTVWQGPVLYVGAVLAAAIVLRLIALALNVWQLHGFTTIAKDVIFQMRRTLLLRLERVSMAEYETVGSGMVASHLVTDLGAIDDFIGAAISKCVVAALSIAGTAVILLWMHWQLGLFVLLLNPAVIYLTILFGRKVKAMKARQNRSYQAFQESLSETLDAIRQIRASNRDRFYLGRGVAAADDMRRFSSAFEWKSEAANRLSFIAFLIGFDVFRATSMLIVVYSDLSIGQMLAVFAYLWFMMGPVQDIINVQYAFSGAQAALDRVNRLFWMRPEPRYPHQVDPFAGKHTVSIALENVRFAYGDGPNVLDGVSLRVERGEKVAVVGASGAGKTTLIQVLLGLYPPTSGAIKFDGVPVQMIGMDVVREHVATVLQHPALFNDSVRMNLTLGRDVPDERIWAALRVAQLAEVVEGLAQGLETPLGRDGVRLSGGQRQRLAVARMVLSDPKVVVLDEATSALDSVTEAALHNALDAFLADRTTLIIAHRLSAVRRADRVLVIEKGRVIEEGRHEELVGGGGLYAALYADQMEY